LQAKKAKKMSFVILHECVKIDGICKKHLINLRICAKSITFVADFAK
jgi:hypothetical protein